MEDLHTVYPKGFTNEQAYKLYVMWHWKERARFRQTAKELRRRNGRYDHATQAYLKMSDYGDPVMQMNVRNHLSAAAYRGILVRVAPGVYRWATAQEWRETHA